MPREAERENLKQSFDTVIYDVDSGSRAPGQCFQIDFKDTGVVWIDCLLRYDENAAWINFLYTRATLIERVCVGVYEN